MRKSVLLINGFLILLFVQCNNNNKLASSQKAEADSLNPDTSLSKVVISAQPLAIDSLPVIGSPEKAEISSGQQGASTDTSLKNKMYPAHQGSDQQKTDSTKAAKSKLKK